MTSIFATSTLLAMTLDDFQRAAEAHFAQMRSEPLLYAFWAGVWVGGFVATFLFLRMLFTRWGDTNVTKKTLYLSLLLHFLGGLLSTRVMLPQSSGPGGEEGRISIRDFSASPPENTGGRESGEPSGGAGNGSSGLPVWEQLPTFAGTGTGRAERPAGESVDAEMPEKQNSGGDGLPPLSLPNLANVVEGPGTAPEAQRSTEKSRPGAELAAGPITEETAEARSEAGTGKGTSRGTRSEPAALSGNPKRIARGAPGDTTPEVKPPREVTSLTGPADPTAAVAKGMDSGAPRIGRTGPATSPLEVPGDAAPASGQGGKAPGPFARSGRQRQQSGTPGTTAGEGTGDSVERVRKGAGGEGVAGAPDLLSARGSPSGLGTGSPGFSPGVLRPGGDGSGEKIGAKMPAPYALRTSPQRKKIAMEMGASEESERAVETSLEWLARHQHRDGYWEPIESRLGNDPDVTFKDFQQNLAERQRSGFGAESGLTALAILAFLGKGYTHEDNPFSDTVDRAIQWLIRQQRSDGFLGGRANRYAQMYCHGMATIAVGEAYGLTKDPALREPLARAVRYIIDQQNPADGGWRYLKGQTGDMSMFGWQLMALKSAQTAGLAVPQETLDRAIDFLVANGDDLKKRGISEYGGLAGYRKDERPKPSMTAEALFCKQMLGIKRTNPSAVEAANYLLQNLPRRSQTDLYYWYYGTLAMYQQGGDAWQKWNTALRDNLVSEQRTDGDFAGSWDPRAPWGDYGGRVFSTALSTLSLEVYYRFLPLYQMGSKLEERTGK